MAKKLPYTPKSQITSVIRRLWLYSRERAAALKRDGKCQVCGEKKKLHVHHIHPIGKEHWAEIEKLIREYVLVNPRFLTTLCKRCHKLQDHDN
jgi:5-methylcytosine-specific restriction endonuclease McrA